MRVIYEGDVGVKLFLGVDPGTKGAYAAIDENGVVVAVDDLPVFYLKGSKTELDEDGVLAAFSVLKNRGVACAALEKVQGLPKQSAPAAFNFGQSYGVIRAAIIAVGIPLLLATPATWKKVVLEGHSKEKDVRRSVACRMFPSARTRLKLKKHADRADALLLAEYARRTFGQH